MNPNGLFTKKHLWCRLTSKATKCILNHGTCQQLQAEMFRKKKKKTRLLQADSDYCLHHCIFLTSRRKKKNHLCISLKMEGSHQGETEAFPLLGKRSAKSIKGCETAHPESGKQSYRQSGWGWGNKWKALPLAGIYLNDLNDSHHPLFQTNTHRLLITAEQRPPV